MRELDSIQNGRRRLDGIARSSLRFHEPSDGGIRGRGLFAERLDLLFGTLPPRFRERRGATADGAIAVSVVLVDLQGFFEDVGETARLLGVRPGESCALFERIAELSRGLRCGLGACSSPSAPASASIGTSTEPSSSRPSDTTPSSRSSPRGRSCCIDSVYTLFYSRFIEKRLNLWRVR